jgi:hypothetical protein
MCPSDNNIMVSWDVMPHSLASRCQCHLFDTKARSSRFLINVSTSLPNLMASHFRRLILILITVITSNTASATEVEPVALELLAGVYCALQSVVFQLVQDTLLDEGLRVVKELVARQNKDSSTGSDNSYCDSFNNESKVQVNEAATDFTDVFIIWSTTFQIYWTKTKLTSALVLIFFHTRYYGCTPIIQLDYVHDSNVFMLCWLYTF